MKRIGIAIMVALFVFAAFGVGAQTRAVFKTVTGKVEIQNPGEQAWQPANAGMEVPIRATISTGFGGGAILDLGASTLTVRQLTRLRIDELSVQNKVTRTNLTMPVGRIRADVKSTAGTTTDFRLRSPVSTAAVRGTGFNADVSVVTVFEHLVQWYSESGIGIDVGAGEMGLVTGGGTPSGGADLRDANASTNPFTSLTGSGGAGGGMPGLGTGGVTVHWN
jgi:hypothetical protein